MIQIIPKTDAKSCRLHKPACALCCLRGALFFPDKTIEACRHVHHVPFPVIHSKDKFRMWKFETHCDFIMLAGKET